MKAGQLELDLSFWVSCYFWGFWVSGFGRTGRRGYKGELDLVSLSGRLMNCARAAGVQSPSAGQHKRGSGSGTDAQGRFRGVLHLDSPWPRRLALSLSTIPFTNTYSTWLSACSCICVFQTTITLLNPASSTPPTTPKQQAFQQLAHPGEQETLAMTGFVCPVFASCYAQSFSGWEGEVSHCSKHQAVSLLNNLILSLLSLNCAPPPCSFYFSLKPQPPTEWHHDGSVPPR